MYCVIWIDLIHQTILYINSYTIDNYSPQQSINSSGHKHNHPLQRLPRTMHFTYLLQIKYGQIMAEHSK